jgi:hypothetical protein
MGQACRYCGSGLSAGQAGFITGGLCASCAGDVLSTRQNTQRFVDALGAPVLFMRGDPRLVVTGNQKALDLFGKRLDQIENHRGGQVFDCIHSYSELGCGLDPNCQDCPIKSAIVETFTQKKSSTRIGTMLDIVRGERTTPHYLEVSTEPIGDFALVRIDRYSP